MDKFIVRLSIIVMNAYIIFVVLNAFNGIDVSEYDYLYTDSLVSGILLATLCHAQGRYHCVWMRAMCYNLIFVPTLNYIDCVYNIIPCASLYLYIICITTTLSIVATIVLAIDHFIKVRRILKHKHNEQLFQSYRRGQV